MHVPIVDLIYLVHIDVLGQLSLVIREKILSGIARPPLLDLLLALGLRCSTRFSSFLLLFLEELKVF
jgi:hypothetical protein